MQQLGAPRRGAPSRSVRALSPIVRRPFGGGSEGSPVSLSGGGLLVATGRIGHSRTTAARTEPHC
eukprot:9945772-Alexandrium_andersonii.AAC.1